MSKVEIPLPRPATRASILKALVRRMSAEPSDYASSSSLASRGFHEVRGGGVQRLHTCRCFRVGGPGSIGSDAICGGREGVRPPLDGERERGYVLVVGR